MQRAVGHDYQARLQQHASQTDAAKGFGGKYGVQKDRVDKSAVGWDHQEKLQQHASQTGTVLITWRRDSAMEVYNQSAQAGLKSL